MSKIKLALICGGPTRERGISLNSARTVLDHLGACQDIDIIPFYVDLKKRFHRISQGQLYSNTPSDFDFKLPEDQCLSREAFLESLKSIDLVFHMIHGAFGEDGELQLILEESSTPFLGPGSQETRRIFDKEAMRHFLRKGGHSALEQWICVSQGEKGIKERIHAFWQECDGLAVVKPNYGGSSIDVSIVRSAEDAYAAVCQVFKGSHKALMENFVYGREFTTIVLQSHETGEPVALLPTEVTVLSQHPALFSYRLKYLPTNGTRWTCPSFSSDINNRIREQASALFSYLGARDFIRLDGWFVNGQILWSDFNPISGLEQNSFLFLQAARTGMTHRHALRYVIQSALIRDGRSLPEPVCPPTVPKKQKIFVLCGGDTAERQVSLMSGLNVFLQLKNTQMYDVHLFVLFENRVWSVPYAFGLFHTVEEVVDECQRASEILEALETVYADLPRILGVTEGMQQTVSMPTQKTIDDFINQASQERAFMFLALHGGQGEDGTIQALLEEKGVLFNGCSSRSCALFMDKYLTGVAVNEAGIDKVMSLPKVVLPLDQVREGQWQGLVEALQTETILAKPKSDGCSAGVVVLRSAKDVETYGSLLRAGHHSVPERTFQGQPEEVILPVHVGDLLFEPFIVCDSFEVVGYDVKHIKHEGWVELTVGLIERASGLYAMNPSITLAEGAVLSLEEKFQGGTGVNLTPPPSFVLTPEEVDCIRRKVKALAETIGVQGYARIDLFYHTKTKTVCIIEVNALPGLTPSTVLYHQGIAENPSVYPRALLQEIMQRPASVYKKS